MVALHAVLSWLSREASVVATARYAAACETVSRDGSTVLELMRAHQLPPAEIVSNPDALYELFIKSISADHG